jgi:hypothetical protein
MTRHLRLRLPSPALVMAMLARAQLQRLEELGDDFALALLWQASRKGTTDSRRERATRHETECHSPPLKLPRPRPSGRRTCGHRTPSVLRSGRPHSSLGLRVPRRTMLPGAARRSFVTGNLISALGPSYAY